MLTPKCTESIESQRERAVESHISRKTSELGHPFLAKEQEVLISQAES